ncbi:SH3 domain-containing protein, partial [Frankia sp. Cpl3]|nr:SH3 domain-containing protein [Frankia sp. Cpl3]
DNVIKVARDNFGQPITRVPKESIAVQGMPSGRSKVDSPLPVHLAGEDLERRRLEVGDTVEVANFTPTLNVRQSPGMSSKVIDVLATRERVEIVKKPTEKDGVLWYQMKSKDGKGWVSGFYVNAVRDERISLAEVLTDDLMRLADDRIKADGRNLYLQGEELNLPWSAVAEAGLQQALSAYPWQNLWLAWTEKKLKEKA